MAAVLKWMRLKNFGAFPKAKLNFARHLNVIVGENGMGKTQLLKLPYAAMAVSAEEGRKRTARPTKSALQPRLAEKLVNVLRPDSLGRLAYREGGRRRAEVMIKAGRAGTYSSFSFSFTAQSRTEVSVDIPPGHWKERAPVYLPTHELLTIYPGFVSLYETHKVEFDETWRDTCLLLGAPELRGSVRKGVEDILQSLEAQLEGSVVLSRSGRFYLDATSGGYVEMPLVAEGRRKIATLARLIATGSLLDEDCLFWDEPESNLNSKLIREVARAILRVCENGTQVFVATHSLFLLREFEMLLEREFGSIERCYFALHREHEGVVITEGENVSDVNPLVLLDEELSQSDRFVEELMP